MKWKNLKYNSVSSPWKSIQMINFDAQSDLGSSSLRRRHSKHKKTFHFLLCALGIILGCDLANGQSIDLGMPPVTTISKFAPLSITELKNSSISPAQLDLSFDLASRLSRVDPRLLRAVCWAESSHLPTTVVRRDGTDKRNSYGICQLKLRTARDMGFTGTAKDLMQPHLNIYYAAQYLAFQLKRYHGNVKKAIKAYNRGHYSGRLNCEYVRRVLKAYKERR